MNQIKTDFMIIGVQKCGTTSLASILSQHPEINFCKQKEPSFFCRNKDWEARIHEYHDLYNPNEIGLRGEASTSYSWYYEYPDTSLRLKKYNKNLKFIYIMRDPIDRIKSHYIHNYLKGYTRKNFLNEVTANPTYINHSRYAVQIRPYIELFGKDRILFLKLEDLIDNSFKLFEQVGRFLGIDIKPFDNLDKSPRNVTSENRKITTLKYLFSPILKYIPSNVKISLRESFSRKNSIIVNINPQLRTFFLNHLIDDITAIENYSDLNLKNWVK
jgi:hypothetical protein